MRRAEDGEYSKQNKGGEEEILRTPCQSCQISSFCLLREGVKSTKPFQSKPNICGGTAIRGTFHVSHAKPLHSFYSYSHMSRRSVSTCISCRCHASLLTVFEKQTRVWQRCRLSSLLNVGKRGDAWLTHNARVCKPPSWSDGDRLTRCLVLRLSFEPLGMQTLRCWI